MKPDAPRTFDVLLTAQEAFPAFECEFLQAKSEIAAGFRIFDPTTKLRSPEALQIGDTWCDLIVDTLNRGVKLSLVITDFDPVVRPNDHVYTWQCVRNVERAGQGSSNPSGLTVHAAMHPARVGILPRLLLWPRSVKELRKNLTEVNARPYAGRQQFLHDAPHLAPMLKWQNETLVPRMFPPPTLVPVSHHQKLAVFDRKRLYIGGLDLNDRRYDTPAHERAASDTWHDTQVIVDGPIAGEAVDHLQNFEAITQGQKPTSTRYLLRTVSQKRKFSGPYLSPKSVVTELASSHAKQIAQSETLIYLETQFFRDRTLARQLARRAKEKPNLSMILVVPGAPEGAAFTDKPGRDVAYGEHLQTRAIEIIQQAFGSRLFIGTPLQRRAAAGDGRSTLHDAPLVYLHAKVSIFDDRLGVVSSANLNGRSFAWDTEAGLTTQCADEVAHLKSRCFYHWLGVDADPDCFASDTACKAWAALARQNAQRHPTQRQGFILPYDAGPAAALGSNLPGVPDELV